MERLAESRKHLLVTGKLQRVDENGRVDIEGALADLIDAAILALTSPAVKAG